MISLNTLYSIPSHQDITKFLFNLGKIQIKIPYLRIRNFTDKVNQNLPVHLYNTITGVVVCVHVKIE